MHVVWQAGTDARDPVTLNVVGNSRFRAPIKSSHSPSGMKPCSCRTISTDLWSANRTLDSTPFESSQEIETDLVVGLEGGVAVGTLGKRLFHGHASVRAIS